MDEYQGARTVEEFYQQISDAYTRSPLEISIFIGFFLLLFGILVYYRVRTNRTEQEVERERTERLYQLALRRSRLSPSQLELIQNLTRHMTRPNEAYLLFEDESLFNTCAVRALEEDGVAPDALAGLRVQLGFGANPTKAPHSTTQIPAGATVLLRSQAKEKPIACEVLAGAKGTGIELRCRPKQLSRVPSSGRSVQMIYHSAVGIFVFDSLVLSRNGDRLLLRHAEQPQRLQRRRYFRKEVQLPVRMERVHPEGPDLHGMVFDLGGGGAALQLLELETESEQHHNDPPDIGDSLYLYLEPDAGQTWKLQARVVRVSRKGIHCVFTAIQEGERDKIYRYLFRSD